MIRHIIEAQQFDTTFLTKFFGSVTSIKTLRTTHKGRRILKTLLAQEELVNFFYEESTRTRVSFAIAAKRLGMDIFETTNAAIFSSVAKGETLEDTMRVLCGYGPRVIVLRHKVECAAQLAADISDRYHYGVHVINGGDGPGQHPTQSLTDVYTIYQKLGHLDNLHVVVAGDLLFGRTTHSLVFLLSRYPGVRFTFVSPKQLAMKPGIIEHLDKCNVPWTATHDLTNVVQDADVVYMTRTQWERLFDLTTEPTTTTRSALGQLHTLLKRHSIKKQSLKCRLTFVRASSMQPHALILHPMPILDEIERSVDHDVDSLPQAAYFDQAANGVLVRMAILLYVCGKEQSLSE